MASGIRGSLRLGMVGLLCPHHAQPRTKLLTIPRPSAERPRPSRRYSGPRRGAAGSRSAHPLPLPLHRAYLRRCRLSGTTRRASRSQDRPSGVRDRQAQRTAQMRRLAQALDRRTNPGLDQLQSPLARDFERYARTVAAFVRLAMIRIMLRRLTQPSRSA